MEENYMNTTLNGHEQQDMYNPETNTLDIRSNACSSKANDSVPH